MFLLRLPLSIFHGHCFLPLSLLLSELEPRLERARVLPSPIRSDLRASAVLRADPDPHLLGLPDLSIPLGPAAAVVLGVDAPHRVNERNSSPPPPKMTSLSEMPEIKLNVFSPDCLRSRPQACATGRRTSTNPTTMARRWTSTTS